jgi:hypothetical protein
MGYGTFFGAEIAFKALEDLKKWGMDMLCRARTDTSFQATSITLRTDAMTAGFSCGSPGTGMRFVGACGWPWPSMKFGSWVSP